jgi:hypothetical protein
MKKARHYFDFVKKHATTLLFIFGFLTDMFLLPDIDNPITKYIGISYIIGIGFLIAVREWVISRNRADDIEQKFYSLSSFGVAYLSGAALSFIFVYALRSADIFVSWPLFLILLISMTANEFFATHTYRFTLDIIVLYIALVFYLIFNTPFILKSQNDKVFALSITFSVLVALMYAFIIHRISETTLQETPKMYALSIGVPMFIGMLYFLNLIPAVPLSLKEGLIAHSVTRDESGAYVLSVEKETKKTLLSRVASYTVLNQQGRVFYFSSVDAPAQITAPVTHVWEFYDTTIEKWVPVTSISFTLSGGREEGYRAYSYKENIFEGLWRVTVKVDERIVGRTKFYITFGESVDVKEVRY